MNQQKQVIYGKSKFYRDMKEARVLADNGESPFGYYADAYFTTVKHVLDVLPDDYRTSQGFDPKNSDVRMQVFMRHPGGCLVAGVDLALAVLSNGMTKEGLQNVKVNAINDGTWVPYSGNADDVTPVIEIIGPYRYFAELETTYLGLLSRCTRVANHVLECLDAAKGTPVLFFPERFDSYAVQEIDGYAYWMAVKFYNNEHDTKLPVIVSSPASAALFGNNGKYQGSTPHALFAGFAKDEVEAMIQFGLREDPNTKRIFLADFRNDVIESSKLVAIEYWKRWLAAWKRDNSEDNEDLKRWRLWGIRIDTSAALVVEFYIDRDLPL
jgi:nicotinate phosphoribosyltransferase